MPIYKRYGRRTQIRVEEVMASPPVTLSKAATVEEAARAMWEKKVGSVLVVEDGRLAGIVTERDMLFALAKSMPPKATSIGSIMSKNIISIGAAEDVSAAIEKMRQANIRHLPITGKDGTPVGMISLRDILDLGASLVGILFRSE